MKYLRVCDLICFATIKRIDRARYGTPGSLGAKYKMKSKSQIANKNEEVYRFHLAISLHYHCSLQQKDSPLLIWTWCFHTHVCTCEHTLTQKHICIYFVCTCMHIYMYVTVCAFVYNLLVLYMQYILKMHKWKK